MTTSVIYEVRVKPLAHLSGRFVDWMENEHADDLLGIEGCKSCQVYHSEGIYYCQYIFDSEDSLKRYLSNDADRLRAKAGKHFQEGDLQIERSEYKLVLQKNN